MTADISHSDTPPGPSASVPSGQLAAYMGDPLDFLEKMAAEYGRPVRDVVRFRLGPQDVYFATAPDTIRQVLTAPPRTYRQGPFIQSIRQAFLGQGLLSSEGEEHRRQRRLIQPLFLPHQVALHIPVMVEEIARLDATWAKAASTPGGRVERPDLVRDLTELSLRIVLRCLFGADLDAAKTAHLADAFQYALDWVSDQAGHPLAVLNAQHQLAPSVRRFLEMRAAIDREVQGLIARRQAAVAAGAAPRDDLLGLLLAARDLEGDGGAMTPKEVRDQIVTFLLAGHITTSKVLSWVWVLLAQHPDVEENLIAELDGVLGSGPARRAPDAGDLEALPLTDAILSEAVRLYPPVPLWMRQRTAEPFTLGGYSVPANVLLLISPWVTQRDERFWPRPTEFRPAERWTPAARAARPRFAYFPFGAGSRQCVGADFTWLEGRLALALLVSRWRIDFAPGSGIPALKMNITIGPRGGLPVVLTLRR